ncbi:MAG: inorganic diphosphatase [Tissierellia bacterium]|nr:inorganic diphosphatase [Tissierellia bacterium]
MKRKHEFYETNDEIIVDAFIEIPKGSSNKYEFDHEKHRIVLDRVLYSPMYYPTDYGFVPDTLSEDGDPIDILVLITNPTFPGCTIQARVIGMFEMRDDKGKDEKLIAVPTTDPRFDDVYSLEDLNIHIEKEFEYFFENYKTLEGKNVEVGGWRNVGDAKIALDEARLRYENSKK